MRFTIFFGKYLVGAYLFGVAFLAIANVVDLLLGFTGHDERDRRLTVSAGQRALLVFFWPFFLPSRRGRNYLRRSWRRIV